MTGALPAKLCLVEDDTIMGESLTHRFALEGVSCDWYQDARSALDAIGKTDYAVVVSDIRLPDQSGEEMFAKLLGQVRPPPPTLFITGFGSIDQAVRLMRNGARDYITKPFDLDELLVKLRALGPVLFAAGAGRESPPVLGVSPVMRELEETLRRVAGHRASILITGESGVGKEYAARYLFQHGTQAQARPFVAINCAAIPDNLLEADLFGYEKGAFTGAVKRHRGVFERAHGGVLFMDEIGDMAFSMQAKLLRAVQEGSVRRIGSETALSVDVRLVCATNKDLKREVKAGGFREDLYYRINVIHVHIPPLRERREDILWFARRFVDEFVREHSVRRYLLSLAERYLTDRDWPGNVRELHHAIERACILARQEILGPRELGASWPALGVRPSHTQGDLKSYLHGCEKDRLLETLEAHHWRIAETAATLGISRKNLWEKMRRHGLESPEKTGEEPPSSY